MPVAVVGAFLGLYLRGFALDVFGQIGLVMLIGLAAKNAILIVEFAKAGFERGQGLVEAALEGARLRLRPILMTSFAFILGCVPLWIAKGAGAAGRQILGTVVISGMLAATGIAIFVIPVLFVMVERLAGAKDLAEARKPVVTRWARAVALGACGLVGCTVGPNYKRPPVSVPEQFYGGEAAVSGGPLARRPCPGGTSSRTRCCKRSWTRRCSKGFDARLAAARVEEARALYGVARGDLLARDRLPGRLRPQRASTR